MAQYLAAHFECRFAMSSASHWVLAQLEKHSFGIEILPENEQFAPDDPRSKKPWSWDLDGILCNGDSLILDGYRFDSSFYTEAQSLKVKTIRVIDSLQHVPPCDAIITQLLFDHEEVRRVVEVNQMWTGLDGFIVRPEFTDLVGAHSEFEYDTFIYVTTQESWDFYQTFIDELSDQSVLAVTNRRFEALCKNVGWFPVRDVQAEKLAALMNSSRIAVLPASTIGIEFLIATGRKPYVRPLATNQQEAFLRMVEAGFWLDGATDGARIPTEVHTAPSLEAFPLHRFISWFND
ncbi:MAG: hypothetical protein O2990_03780 [Bacteroidetes bacterium]|nr:hypothetical protein [Bacteroidota bacterium]